MTDRLVRTHTHVSNRAKPKAPGRHQDVQRKVVFKSALDNPFHIAWLVFFSELSFYITSNIVGRLSLSMFRLRSWQ